MYLKAQNLILMNILVPATYMKIVNCNYKFYISKANWLNNIKLFSYLHFCCVYKQLLYINCGEFVMVEHLYLEETSIKKPKTGMNYTFCQK